MAEYIPWGNTEAQILESIKRMWHDGTNYTTTRRAVEIPGIISKVPTLQIEYHVDEYIMTATQIDGQEYKVHTHTDCDGCGPITFKTNNAHNAALMADFLYSVFKSANIPATILITSNMLPDMKSELVVNIDSSRPRGTDDDLAREWAMRYPLVQRIDD